MSTLDILGNTSEQADSIRLMLKVRGMKDGRFIDADPLIILKADNHQGSDRWDVYVSKTVYPTAESYGTLAGVLRMLADDVEIMAREKEMGGGQYETIHPDYIPEDFRELLRMACDSVWEQGELYSEDLLLAAFKPAIDEHDRQIAEQAWENGYIQALKNMNPMPGEEPPEYTPNPYRKENA